MPSRHPVKFSRHPFGKQLVPLGIVPLVNVQVEPEVNAFPIAGAYQDVLASNAMNLPASRLVVAGEQVFDHVKQANRVKQVIGERQIVSLSLNDTDSITHLRHGIESLNRVKAESLGKVQQFASATPDFKQGAAARDRFKIGLGLLITLFRDHIVWAICVNVNVSLTFCFSRFHDSRLAFGMLVI